MREGSLCFCGAQPKSNDNNTTRDKGKTDLLSWSRASKQASNINQAGKQKKMATELGTNQLTSPFLPLPFPCPLKYKKTVPWANRRHSLFSLEGCEPPPPLGPLSRVQFLHGTQPVIPLGISLVCCFPWDQVLKQAPPPLFGAPSLLLHLYSFAQTHSFFSSFFFGTSGNKFPCGE